MVGGQLKKAPTILRVVTYTMQFASPLRLKTVPAPSSKRNDQGCPVSAAMKKHDKGRLVTVGSPRSAIMLSASGQEAYTVQR